jgi:hypothetical protein
VRIQTLQLSLEILTHIANLSKMSPVTKSTNNLDLAAYIKCQKKVATVTKAASDDLQIKLASLKADIDAINESNNRRELQIQKLEGRVFYCNDAEEAQQYSRNLAAFRAGWNAHMEKWKEIMALGKIRMNNIEQDLAALEQWLQ